LYGSPVSAYWPDGDNWRIAKPEERGVGSEVLDDMLYQVGMAGSLNNLCLIKDGYSILESYAECVIPKISLPENKERYARLMNWLKQLVLFQV
jgi:hypothetical protein